MNIKVNDIVEFYLDDDFVPKTGVVNGIDGDQVLIKVQHGVFHDKYVVVNMFDIVDDSFDKYDTSDEKLYAWYDGE